MSGLSFTGIGSGVPVKDIVTGLVNAEAGPFQERVLKKEAKITTNISANGALKSALTDLSAALEKLKDVDNYQLRKASGGDEFVGISADKTAQVGSYDIKVNNLAQAHKTMSNTFDKTLAVGEGKLSFATAADVAAGEVSFSVDVSDTDTLEDVRDKINDAVDNDVMTATIITEDSGEQRLVMTAAKTGLDNAITVTGTQADGVTPLDPASRLNDLLSTNLVPVKPALDASITIDNAVTLTNATDTFTNAIDGITLTAKKAHGVDDDVSGVAIAEDNKLIETELSNFVDKYNAFADLAASLGKADGEGQSGALVGDSMLRGIKSRLRNELSSPFDSGNGNTLSLVELGVTSDKFGKLTFDSSELKKTLDADPAAVQEFFIGTDANPGLAATVDSLVGIYTESGGLIDSRIEGFEKQLTSLQKDTERFNAKMQSYEARLYAQYNAMDLLVANMTSTSTYLMGQLENLPGVVKKS